MFDCVCYCCCGDDEREEGETVESRVNGGARDVLFVLRAGMVQQEVCKWVKLMVEVK